MMRTVVVRLADESQITVAAELTPLVRTLVAEEVLPREFLTDDGQQLRTDREGVLAVQSWRSTSCPHVASFGPLNR